MLSVGCKGLSDLIDCAPDDAEIFRRKSENCCQSSSYKGTVRYDDQANWADDSTLAFSSPLSLGNNPIFEGLPPCLALSL